MKKRWGCFLILIAAYFHQNGLASSSTEVECQMEYCMEYSDGRRILLTPQWPNSCPEAYVVPDLSVVGVQPVVKLSTCHTRAASDTPTFLIGHTLLTVASSNQTSCVNSTSTECPRPVWSVEVPDYMDTYSCIQVSVRSWRLGAGVEIQESSYKIQTEEENSVPTINAAALSLGEEDYDVIDVAIYDSIQVVLIKDTSANNNTYQLHYLSNNNPDGEEEPEVEISISTCVTSSSQEGQVVWRMNNGRESCASWRPFVPTGLVVVSLMEVYVIGNGLLFSPNKAEVFYSLQTPWTILEITSFAISSDRELYALIWRREVENQTMSNVTELEIWIGYVGKTAMFQVYPSTLCDLVWQSLGFELEDLTLTNATLLFDDSNNLYLESNNSSLRFPLSLLVLNQGYKSMQEDQNTSCITPQPPDLLNSYHPLYQLDFQLHPLVLCTSASTTCPFITEVIVQAQACEQITRNKFHIADKGALQRLDRSSMPELNCQVSGNKVPENVFLDKSQQYNFTMEFILDTNFPGLPDLSLAVKLSIPEALRVRVSKSYHGGTNSVLFQVNMQELQYYSAQIEPGFISASVDVSLHIMGTTTECINPSATSLHLPGHTHTKAHIGCPPGLSITFDANATRSRYNQFCNPSANISCFYFGNNFYPTFLMVDLVTEDRSIFTGHYTLKAIAGGSSENGMTLFSPSDNVEAGIWTPVNESKQGPVPVYHYDDSGITWLCSTKSPCGEELPGSGRSPEYFLLLEASNVLVNNDTYCALSVQFLIKIHGLPMGGITTVVAVIMFTILCSLSALLMFVTWHYRLKFLYLKDLLTDKWNGCWPDNRDRLIVLLRKHRGKINPTF